MNTKPKAVQSKQIIRKRKSEALTPTERRRFAKWVSGQPTKIDAAEMLKVSRGALDDLLSKGSGKPENIAKIKTLISEAA